MITQNNTEIDNTVPFSMYHAFTDKPYSGSQAVIILNASNINHKNRIRIASEMDVPATAFVNFVSDQHVIVQFFSTVMELPMCGHATVCLITELVKNGLLLSSGGDWVDATLVLPNDETIVQYRYNQSGRIETMLDVNPSKFKSADLDFYKLCHILGISTSDISTTLPAEIATSSFVHLCLPMRDLKAIQSLKPDFKALAEFCIASGIETVATFTTEVLDKNSTVHVRDFCPAVGVTESAAAGTTNASLSHYLLRNGIIKSDNTNNITVYSEQGVEIERPSKITTIITLENDEISRLQVGGVATNIVTGQININL